MIIHLWVTQIPVLWHLHKYGRSRLVLWRKFYQGGWGILEGGGIVFFNRVDKECFTKKVALSKDLKWCGREPYRLSGRKWNSGRNSLEYLNKAKKLGGL